MFVNKYLCIGCLSVFSLIFGIVINLSFVNAQRGTGRDRGSCTKH